MKTKKSHTQAIVEGNFANLFRYGISEVKAIREEILKQPRKQILGYEKVRKNTLKFLDSVIKSGDLTSLERLLKENNWKSRYPYKKLLKKVN